jgi:hypothetical protein
MNERIKELEKLATPRCYDETGCYIGNRFDPEKFAELIVRECMIIGFNTVYRVDDDSAAVAVYQNIQEHFGVNK